MRKELFLALSLLCLTLGAKAQSLSASIGPESKDLYYRSAIQTTVIGEDPSTVLMITRQCNHFLQGMTNPDLAFRRTDKALNTIQEATIENSKESEFFGYGISDSTASVLMCDRSRKQTQLSRTTIDRKSFGILKSEVIHTFNLERKSEHHLWHQTSDNGQYTAVVSIQLNHNDELICDLMMFDNQMNILWDIQHGLKGVTDLFVSDHGELYVMSMNRKAMETTIYIDKINSKHAISAQMVIPDGLNSGLIANVIDDRILIGGTLRYAEAHRNELSSNGLFGLCYDLKSQQIVKLSMTQLHHDDMAVLTDKKQSAKIRKTVVDDLIIDQTCATSFGGVFTFTRPFAIQKTSSNGETTQYFSRIGLVVLAMDANGDLLFKVPIRHYQMQLNDSDQLTTPLFSDGKNVYLIQTEHPKTDPSYNIAKRTDCVRVMHDKVNTALYTINPTGEVSKKVLINKHKSLITGQCHTWYNDNYILFHTTGKTSQVLQLKRQ